MIKEILIIFLSYFLLSTYAVYLKKKYLEIFFLFFLIHNLFILYNYYYEINSLDLIKYLILFNFLVSLHIWVYGCVYKSISLKILRQVHYSKKNLTKKQIENVVRKEFNNRIEILLKNNLLRRDKKKLKISKKGLKIKKIIFFIRKFFRIDSFGFYY